MPINFGKKNETHAPAFRRKRKKWLLPLIAVILTAGVGFGIRAAARGSGEPVAVYEFNWVGQTELWGDSTESYGPVTTDRIQTVFLTDTQTITEVKVAQGDRVKKGDVLLTFDTTLSQLDLERQKLEVDRMELQLKDEENRLMDLRNMQPMREPDWSGDSEPSEPEPDLGRLLSMEWEIQEDQAEFLEGRHDGSSPDKAVVVWLRGDYYEAYGISYESLLRDCRLIEAMRDSWYEEKSADDVPSQASALPELSDGSEEVVESPAEPVKDQPEETPEGPPAEPPAEPTPEPEPESPVEPIPEPEPESPEEPVTDPTADPTTDPTIDPTVEPTEPAGPVKPDFGDAIYIVFKVTADNRSRGTRYLWQGIRVRVESGGANISFKPFDAEGTNDYSLEEYEEAVFAPIQEFDPGGIYTAEELVKMRKEQQDKVWEQDLKLRMARADFNIKQREFNNGTVVADFDGQVVSLLTEEEARQEGLPMIKISDGGGFLIEGYISELERDNISVGQEVDVNDWMSSGSYTGTIRTIGDMPSVNGYWPGVGNPNATFYPFTVYVDGSANLQEGRYASVFVTAGSGEKGIYLNAPFVRTEEGRSWVCVRGDNDRLELRPVTVIRNRNGFIEIMGDITPEDRIAFPYGKNVKEGARTVDGNIDELYGY